MKKGQDLFLKLDLTRFFPVQHKETEDFYAIDVAENPDFDEAALKDKFLCYPVVKARKPKLKSGVVLRREVLQPIPLML
ncbi:hypothetical protein [Adhaeribacter rhizoryzae]|uniref:Uncharacterized protein n=1 Tax=Adhaeribacter rhizoryzae TaxID=2607907 RepID=A0A5M6DRI6_9BACT|nr:hypothetical protein [Adhaeribacter rhizoryzae]KAA5548800.1 hypothetical protein F0145_04615 [Adhaeribacter rhizoryzae]